MTTPLRVLDAARSVVDDINRLIDAPGHGLIYDRQLRLSAGSISANIREAMGRRNGPERNQFLRVARGSAEESDEHLRANLGASRLPQAQYWRLHNRLIAVIRMLTSLMETSAATTPKAAKRTRKERK